MKTFKFAVGRLLNLIGYPQVSPPLESPQERAALLPHEIQVAVNRVLEKAVAWQEATSHDENARVKLAGEFEKVTSYMHKNLSEFSDKHIKSLFKIAVNESYLHMPAIAALGKNASNAALDSLGQLLCGKSRTSSSATRREIVKALTHEGPNPEALNSAFRDPKDWTRVANTLATFLIGPFSLGIYDPAETEALRFLNDFSEKEYKETGVVDYLTAMKQIAKQIMNNDKKHISLRGQAAECVARIVLNVGTPEENKEIREKLPSLVTEMEAYADAHPCDKTAYHTFWNADNLHFMAPMLKNLERRLGEPARPQPDVFKKEGSATGFSLK